MNIDSDLLDYVFSLIAQHQPLEISGVYDGTDGVITLTFINNPQEYDVAFTYTGVSYNQFREILCESAGEAIKQHNAAMGIPDRSEFIALVTE